MPEMAGSNAFEEFAATMTLLMIRTGACSRRMVFIQEGRFMRPVE